MKEVDRKKIAKRVLKILNTNAPLVTFDVFFSDEDVANEYLWVRGVVEDVHGKELAAVTKIPLEHVDFIDSLAEDLAEGYEVDRKRKLNWQWKKH